MTEELVNDDSNGCEVGPHGSSSDFFGGQVAGKRFVWYEILEQDPHDFGLFFKQTLSQEHRTDGVHFEVVSVVDLVLVVPVNELVYWQGELMFLEDRLNDTWVWLYLVV